MGLGNSLQTAQAGGAGGPSVGGWVELGRTTLGSANSDMDVTGLADKRYLMILGDFQSPSGSEIPYLRMGNGSFDSGNNYASRASYNGGSDYTNSSGHNCHYRGAGLGGNPHFDVGYITNLSGEENLGQWWNVDCSAGPSAAPGRDEGSFKHVFTSNPIDQIQRTSLGSVTYASGSEVVVLGWDPADDHTTNFWTELASVDLSGGAASSLDSGTILAKKYLWVQMLMEQSADSDYPLRFNSDSGANYTYTYRTNGGTEFNHTSRTGMYVRSTTANLPVFVNMFIVNTSANEKLIIEHDIKSNTAGAGNGPLRTEQVGKWANTSAQITSVQLHSGSGNLASKTIMKIWGSD
tara:strand:- start:711 stop:1760 length:1050 start_codon:yes stop_codon:yes gene_type:complete